MRRRVRPSRPLPYAGGGAADQGPRSIFSVDMRVVDVAWTARPLDEIRAASRGGRLSLLFGGMDLDPRRSLQRNARTLSPARAQQLFDALCEELAEAVIYDVPRAVWVALLPLLLPHASGESPYPLDGTLPPGDALRDGLVVICEGRLMAESALVALSPARSPPRPIPHATDPGGEAKDTAEPADDPVDAVLWSEILTALLPMLEAVRDQQRALLIEA